MKRLLARLLIVAAPSVPLGLRGRVATHTSVAGHRGEAVPAAGSGTPEGEGASLASRPPAVHPELLLNWRPAPEHRGELSDAYLAGAISSWSEQTR